MSGFLPYDDEYFSCSSSEDFQSLPSNASSDDNFSLDQNLNSIFNSDSHCLNLIHINAQSVPAHYSDFLASFTGVHVDCILVSESWLKPSLSSQLFRLPEYSLIRNDRTGKGGGGVCIYIRNNLAYKTISQSPATYSGSLEYLFIEITTYHTKFLVGVVYSPSSSINYFDQLEQLLEHLTPSYSDVILMGDFNTCLLKNDNRSQKLKSLVSSINMTLLPLSETHFPPNFSPSLLDLIICSNPLKVIAHGQLTAPFSYHDLLFLRYKVRAQKRKQKVILQRNLKNINLERLNEDALKIDWSSVLNASDIDEKVRLFNNILTNLYELHAPMRLVRIRHFPAPWLTDTIKKLMSKRNKAKTKCKKFPTDENVAAYKKMRNLCNRMCRDAKRRYIHSSLDNSTTPEKWRFLKSLGVGKFLDTSTITSDLNALNTHFSTPPVILTDSKKSQSLLKLANDTPPLCESFAFQEIAAGEVKKSILSISTKATGSDGLSRDMLVLVIDLIVPIITHILNFSLANKIFPSHWKRAHVIPLPKSPNPNSFSDFRPISILPILSKVIENAVFKQLSTFLYNNKLLNPFQSGFRPFHSTVTALLKVTDDIRYAMDNKKLTILILLDFSNAFNSVDFDILLGILRSLNISPSAVDWFHSYLHGRQQRIRTDEACSDWAKLSAGVPQGGVLSPLLFAIFINEITKILSSHYHLYADDLQLYRHAALSELDSAVIGINADLAAIKNWADSYGLLVNPNKSQALLIGSSPFRNRINLNSMSKILFDGIPLEYTSTAKNLGLTLDSNLSWSAQINQVSKRLHYSIHCLRRLQNFLPLRTKIMLAQTLLLPILDYADVCYLDATEELLDKLERLQNLCIRFIYGLRKFDHVSDFRRQLKWLPIRLRRNMHILTVLFNIFNNSSPTYLCERFKLSPPSVRPVRSCVSKNPLDFPPYNTVFYKKSFTVEATRLWNSLPEQIRDCQSVNTFKLRVKEHYLSLS